MSKDTFLTRFFPIGDTGEEMEICLAYNEGGINYFNYANEKRGLYLHCTPVRREARNGYTSTTRLLMDDRGRKVLMCEMPRRNRKTGALLADNLEPSLEAIANAAIVQDWAEVARLAKATV